VTTVVLTDPALDDLRRIGPTAAPRVIDWCLLLQEDPGAGTSLVDEATQFHKLVGNDGSGHIVYDVSGDVVTVREIWLTGGRTDGEAYAETLHWMQSADPPELVALARVLQRLGRLTATRPMPHSREPVPDCLADALVDQAGLRRLDVAATDAATAFDMWNRYVSTTSRGSSSSTT
jgi:mRNA interferase RelE/StbE